jgi:peptidoglycan hydrolase CwlO-like protein
MKRLLLLLTSVLLITLLPDGLAAKGKRQQQSQPRTAKTVQQEKKQTARDIEATKKQITENTTETRRQLNRINSLAAELTQQGIEIDQMQVRINDINEQIKSVSDSITLLDKDVKKLQQSYAKSLRTMHDSRKSLNKWVFIFSSESFTQAWRRVMADSQDQTAARCYQ